MTWIDNIKGIFRKEAAVESPVLRPYVYVNNNSMTQSILLKSKEQVDAAKINAARPDFKGTVVRDMVQYPKDLGEAHPVNMEELEELTKKFGIVNAVVDKNIDFIMGPGFTVVSENLNAQTIIEQFIQDYDLIDAIRPWIKDALIKGTGFMELGGKKNEGIKGVKTLDSKWCYILRDDKGILIEVNQVNVGGRHNLNGYGKTSLLSSDNIIRFEPWEIAILTFNRIGDCPYGYGTVYPAISSINDYLGVKKESMTLLKRKANAPLHVKMGMAGKTLSESVIPKDSDVDAMGQKLEWLNNKHEWCTNPFVDMKVLDFGNIEDKFTFIIEHDEQIIYETFQVPAVLMGQGNIPEGLAQVQMAAFERRIMSLRAEIEKVIENKIFKRVLLAQGINAHVEIVWGEDTTTEKYARAQLLIEVMKLPFVNPVLLEDVEQDFSKLMGYESKDIQNPKVQKQKEEQQPQPRVPGSNATEKFYLAEVVEND